MEFKWLNESTIKKTADRIEIKAPGQTDFFVEVLMNVRREFSRNHFVMHRIIIQKWKEILCLKSKFHMTSRILMILHQ